MNIRCIFGHRWEYWDEKRKREEIFCSRCHIPLPHLSRPGQRRTRVHGHLMARYLVENGVAYELVKRSK